MLKVVYALNARRHRKQERFKFIKALPPCHHIESLPDFHVNMVFDSYGGKKVVSGRKYPVARDSQHARQHEASLAIDHSIKARARLLSNSQLPSSPFPHRATRQFTVKL